MKLFIFLMKKKSNKIKEFFLENISELNLKELQIFKQQENYDIF